MIIDDVYYDSDAIKELIEKYEPLYGLYLHEIALIHYADMGFISYPNPSFPSPFSYQLYTKFPSFFLEFMIKKGYICIKPASEALEHLHLRQLNTLLVHYSLKRSNSITNAIKRIESSLSNEQINEYLGSFCVPSEKGKEILEKTIPLHLDYYYYEKNKCLVERKEKIVLERPTPPIVDCKLFISYCDGELSAYILPLNSRIGEKVGYHYNCLYEGEIEIFVNNEPITKVYCISEIKALPEINTVLLITEHPPCGVAAAPNTERTYCYHCIDAKQFTYDVIENTSIGFNGLYSLQDISSLCAKPMHDNNFLFFFSYGKEIAKFIIKYLIETHNIVSFERVEPITDDDENENYSAEIEINNQYAIYLIAYMRKEGYILSPKLYGTDMVYFIDYLMIVDDSRLSKIHEIRYKYEIASCMKTYNTEEQIGRLLSFFNNNKQLALESICKRYTVNTLTIHTSIAATGTIVGSHLALYQHIYGLMYNDTVKWRTEITDILTKLYESGDMPTKWVSEFSLYMLVKANFDDCVYQYAADWLGQQSLDIYIPSKRVGIEYQGIQHYQPVDIFGGKKHFEKQQERDKKKRKLCSENGVTLVEWSYNTPITLAELKRCMKQIGIKVGK